MPKRIKIALIGDGSVGKTSICFRLVNDKFDPTYIPTIFETSPFHMTLQGREYSLLITDTAGQENYGALRKSTVYGLGIDVFILCYAIDDEDSFRNIKEKWIPELKENGNGKPVILVGTKTDLRRTGNTENMMSNIDGMDLKHEIGAWQFFECTSKDPFEKRSVKIIFEAAISCYVEGVRNVDQGQQGCCTIM